MIQFLTAEATKPVDDEEEDDEYDDDDVPGLQRLLSDQAQALGDDMGATANSPTPGDAAYLPPPVTNPMPVARLQKMKKSKAPAIPPSPIVVQMIEMGFTRKKVEYAIKSLGE